MYGYTQLIRGCVCVSCKQRVELRESCMKAAKNEKCVRNKQRLDPLLVELNVRKVLFHFSFNVLFLPFPGVQYIFTK